MQITESFIFDVLRIASQELDPIEVNTSCCNLNVTDKKINSSIYKGTLQQTKDEERFTYIKVKDAFITKLTQVAQEKLDPKFENAPYLPTGEKGRVGAHISLTEGGSPPLLSPRDEGKEVYFRLKPIIWDWQHEGSRLNGRILAVVVELLEGEGKRAIERHGFWTSSLHHITFAMRKEDKEDKEFGKKKLTPQIKTKIKKVSNQDSSMCFIL